MRKGEFLEIIIFRDSPPKCLLVAQQSRVTVEMQKGQLLEIFFFLYIYLYAWLHTLITILSIDPSPKWRPKIQIH